MCFFFTSILNCTFASYTQDQHFHQDLVEFEHEKEVAELRGKTTPEKVRY